jgi:hypothetical protein
MVGATGGVLRGKPSLATIGGPISSIVNSGSMAHIEEMQ